MVITRNCNVAKILKETLKESFTPNFNSSISAVEFSEGSGIYLVFEDSCCYYFKIKDVSTDFTAGVQSPLIINAICAILDQQETVVIEYDGESVKVGDYKFKTYSELRTGNRNDEQMPIMTFTKEQYDKLDEDFDYTLGNYFANKKNTHCIGIANKEGKIYKVCPGAVLYKLESFDAVVDSVEAENVGGHDTSISLMPKRLYNLTKHFNENLKLVVNGNTISIDSDTVCVNYSCMPFGTRMFEHYIENNVKFDGVNISSLKDFVNKYIKPISDNLFANDEDPNITLIVENGKATAKMKQMTVTGDVECENIEINVDIAVLTYLLNNFDDLVIKELSDTEFELRSGDTYLSIPNNKYAI